MSGLKSVKIYQSNKTSELHPVRPIKICVEGNIASGKSTFLQYLKPKSNFQIHPEPLSLWQNVKNVNLFDEFYSDPKKYGFAFQIYVLLTQIGRNFEPSNKPVQIYERSVGSSENCFIKAMEQTKAIDKTMRVVLEKYIEFLNTHFDNNKPDLVIYIKTSPHILLERINSRGRSEERSIDEEYLLILHNLHEQWIRTIDPSKVFTINGDLMFDQLENDYSYCIDHIEQLLDDRKLEFVGEELTNLFVD